MEGGENMEEKGIQIALDPKLSIQLRHTVLEEVNISMNKQQELRVNSKTKEYPTWDMVCAIMDRIDDTVDYLNHLKLNIGKYPRNAFDFFEFMNQSTVIIDCIDTLAKIYNVSLYEENSSTHIFNQRGYDGNGTDKKYFKYLRSLCAVHPIETSYYRQTFQDNDFESCPFVVWDDLKRKNSDLLAVVYTNKDDNYRKEIPIRIKEVFEYVSYRYSLLEKIIQGVQKYHTEIIQSYIDTPMKRHFEFDNYIDYLKYLRSEEEKRIGDDRLYILDFVISLFNLSLSNPENQNHYKKYCNALQYAIGFQHNALQRMQFEKFDNNGIRFPERNAETTLLHELHYLGSKSQEAIKYGYEIGKLTYLSYDDDNESIASNKSYAYSMLETIKPFLEKYVSFEGAQGDFEHYALVQIALYFDCLESKSRVNKNIPNEFKYRDRLLSDEELEELIKEDPIDNTRSTLFEELMKLAGPYFDLKKNG